MGRETHGPTDKCGRVQKAGEPIGCVPECRNLLLKEDVDSSVVDRRSADVDFVRTPVGRTRRGCHVFGPRALRTFARLAAAAPGGVHTPIDCELSALPPVLLQVSSSESLFRQVHRLSVLLERAGVPTDLHVWPGQVHVFQAATLIPEAQEAIAAMSAWVERAWAAPVAATA